MAAKKKNKATRRKTAKSFTDKQAFSYISSGKKAVLNKYIKEIGGLKLPNPSAELKNCTAIVKLIRDYARRPVLIEDGKYTEPSRPLSIAIFGPPGSGKSYTATQLVATALAGNLTKKNFLKINLSQLENFSDFAREIDGFLDKKPNNRLRFIFIDEFDCTNHETPIGWLKYFLAPMQDGELKFKKEDADGNVIEIKDLYFGKTVLLFAGGTSDSFHEFPLRHEKYFVNNKGPDFVSRLRGYLNIEGINVDPNNRVLRRTLMLERMLGARGTKLEAKKGRFNIDFEELRSLLNVGFYKHGARSLEAVLDMSYLSRATSFTKKQRADKEALRIHVSHGPLDGKRVGISVNEDDANSIEVFCAIASIILDHGAGLAYGGNIKSATIKGTTGIIDDRPSDLLSDDSLSADEKWSHFHSYSCYPNSVLHQKDKPRSSIKKIEMVNTLSKSEKQEFDLPEEKKLKEFTPIPIPSKQKGKLNRTGGYNANYHVAYALSLFRMRYRLAKDINYLVAMGGKQISEEMPWGRYPGIFEEVLLAMWFDRPVYILGCSGGAAGDLGILFDLAETPATIPPSLQDPEDGWYVQFKMVQQKHSDKFDVPFRDMQVNSYEELTEKLIVCWKENKNGLTEQENRVLFQAEDPDQCAKLIMKGMLRLTWDE